MSKSAERTLQLLLMVANHPEPLGLMELAAKAGFDKSTAARSLQTLERFALISRDPHSKRYAIGSGLLSLSAAVSRKSDLLRVIRPHLEYLRDESGETVSLYLRTGDNRVCVDGFESYHSIRRVLPLGEAVPLYKGSAGKVILAYLPQAEIDRLTAEGQRAGIDAVKLRSQLDLARREGYLILESDRLPGANTVSVALFGPGGVIGSITVAGPAERWSVQAMQCFAPNLVQRCKAISEQLVGSSLATTRL